MSGLPLSFLSLFPGLWSIYNHFKKQRLQPLATGIHSLNMPCVRKSTLSSALTAATATLSSIYSGSVPTATSAAVQTSAAVAGGAAAAQATGSGSSASDVPTATNNQTTYAGINIAGFDFGCGTDGTCTVVCLPHLVSSDVSSWLTRNDDSGRHHCAQHWRGADAALL